MFPALMVQTMDVAMALESTVRAPRLEEEFDFLAFFAPIKGNTPS